MTGHDNATARDDRAEVGGGIYGVELAGLGEQGEYILVLGAAFGAGEEMVLAAE